MHLCLILYTVHKEFSYLSRSILITLCDPNDVIPHTAVTQLIQYARKGTGTSRMRMVVFVVVGPQHVIDRCQKTNSPPF